MISGNMVFSAASLSPQLDKPAVQHPRHGGPAMPCNPSRGFQGTALIQEWLPPLFILKRRA
jgi:hypothetical protein